MKVHEREEIEPVGPWEPAVTAERHHVSGVIRGVPWNSYRVKHGDQYARVMRIQCTAALMPWEESLCTWAASQFHPDHCTSWFWIVKQIEVMSSLGVDLDG